MAELVSSERARQCASLLAAASLDGVYSHGINRFPRFVPEVRNGVVNPNASLELVSRFAALERWNGHQGVGNLNARHCMDRAIALCREYGWILPLWGAYRLSTSKAVQVENWIKTLCFLKTGVALTKAPTAESDRRSDSRGLFTRGEHQLA